MGNNSHNSSNVISDSSFLIIKSLKIPIYLIRNSSAKLIKKVVTNEGFWKINANRPKIKAIRGRTRKFRNRDYANLGGLKKKLGCQIVTPITRHERVKLC